VPVAAFPGGVAVGEGDGRPAARSKDATDLPKRRHGIWEVFQDVQQEDAVERAVPERQRSRGVAPEPLEGMAGLELPIGGDDPRASGGAACALSADSRAEIKDACAGPDVAEIPARAVGADEVFRMDAATETGAGETGEVGGESDQP